jgi:nicotinamide-nucleotide amidase
MPSDALTALATLVGAKLRGKGLMLTTAESCTGGWVAQAVTAIAGSSDWFERGFVTYSNASKMQMLRVTADTLRTHGAVSEQTAREMAAGALARSRAQVAVAITGIAGPSGGSAEKPVGMVCFAWAKKGDVGSAVTHRFNGDRESVRRQSVIAALQGVLDLLGG